MRMSTDSITHSLDRMSEAERAKCYDQVREEFQRAFCQPYSIVAGTLHTGQDDQFMVMAFPDGASVMLFRDGRYDVLQKVPSPNFAPRERNRGWGDTEAGTGDAFAQYLFAAGPAQLPAIIDAMAEAGVDFNPRDNLIAVAEDNVAMPDQRVRYGSAIPDLVASINEYLAASGETILVPDDHDEWDDIRAHQFLQMSVNEFLWSNGPNERGCHIPSLLDWSSIVNMYPLVFGEERRMQTVLFTVNSCHDDDWTGPTDDDMAAILERLGPGPYTEQDDQQMAEAITDAAAEVMGARW